MVQVITTGGTIEGLEYDDENNASTTTTVTIQELLQRVPFKWKYNIDYAFSKDSRFITDNDRNNIVEIIQNSRDKHILITHGTLTMVETAKFLGKLSLQKTIILTGAFVLGTDPNTDAVSNLKFALTQFKNLQNEVYIAMHQNVFHWKNVKKNTKTNQFENLN